MGWLEALLATLAGLTGGFISTLASNGSAVTLPALEFLGFPEHVANGTNRLSVVALGLVGTISFHRQGLLEWRKGSWIALLVALGTLVGSFVAVKLSEAVLDGIVTMGLLIVLGLLLLKPGRWLRGKEGALRPFDWRQATAYFAIGMQSLLIFGETGEVNWAAGIPLALGSAAGAYAASLLATREWAKIWVYRFLVLLVILSIVHLLVVDTSGFLSRNSNPTYYW